MTTPHTPGPWTASAHIVYSGPHHRVATVQAVGTKANADARLIAAAPELLALLVRYRNETPLGHQPHMIAHLADAAIAKATGAA